VGQKWVEAFENIDRDTNRLPRGRKYAKDGAVLEIKIQKKFYNLCTRSRNKTYSV